MLESDNEDYEFDYEDNSEEESPDVDIENKYYNAKQIKATDPDAAIKEFLDVVSSEKEKGDWWVFELLSRVVISDVNIAMVRGFKALKQAIKLRFRLKQHDKVCVLMLFARRGEESCLLSSQGPRTLWRAPHVHQVRRHSKLL